MKVKIILLSLVFLMFAESCGEGKRKRRAKDSEKTEQAVDIENEFDGKVIGIVDGDTIDALYEEQSVRIRLEAIDCPEKAQPFGQKAKQFISSLCFGKMIHVKKSSKDRNGRLIAFCFLEDGTNINYAMVENGYAWHFVKYSKDNNLAGIEDKAKAQRVGLWSDDAPIEPWNWRKGTRE
jgi:micrococcal nuclease